MITYVQLKLNQVTMSMFGIVAKGPLASVRSCPTLKAARYELLAGVATISEIQTRTSKQGYVTLPKAVTILSRDAFTTSVVPEPDSATSAPEEYQTSPMET